MRNKFRNLPKEAVMWETFVIIMLLLSAYDIIKLPDKTITSMLPCALPAIVAALALLVTILRVNPSTPNFYKHGAIISAIIGVPALALAIVKYPDGSWSQFAGTFGGCIGYTAIFLLFYLITKHYQNKKKG